MGACGAAISTRREHPPLVAVVLPAAVLVAEGLFLLYDRKVWRYNVVAQTYHDVYVSVALALIAIGFALSWVFAKKERGRASLLVAGVGVLGAIGFAVVERVIATVV